MKKSLLATLALTLLPSATAFAQASVRDLVPSAAPAGARMMVTGRGLADPAITVTFATDANAAVIQRTDRSLEVVVPTSAVTGNVRIANGATLIAEKPFTVASTPTYIVSTLHKGSSSNNSTLRRPWGTAVILPDGTIAVADESNHDIRLVTPQGAVSVLAGSSQQGFKDGKGTAARFKAPRGITFDSVRRVLYVSDTGNCSIREVALDGTVKTLAGDGKQGYKNGTGAAAQFKDPYGLTVGSDGAIYVADSKNYRIRRVTTAGVVTTFAGNGQKGNSIVNGPLLNSTFFEPRGIVALGNDFYIADTKNNAIRKISGGQVTTIISSARTDDDGEDDDGHDGDDDCDDGENDDIRADSGDDDDDDDDGEDDDDDDDDDDCPKARVLKHPTGIGVDEAGDLIVSDSQNDRIRKIQISVDPPVMTTIAGTGKNGYKDGPGNIAQFKDPVGLSVAGAIYVADEDNNAVRRLCPEVRVTGIFSPSAAVTAGTEVRIFGTGFIPGGTTVRISGVAATNITWLSSTELSAKLPQNLTGGSVSVSISACGGDAGPESFVIDSTPPVISITNGGTPLADNSMFKTPVVPVITATDEVDPAPVVTATLNGLTFASGTPVTADGQYVLVATAQDAAGNSATQTVRFLIDATPPAVTVLEGSAPFPAGQTFNRPVVIDLIISDLTAITADVRVDGAPYVLKQPYAIEGTHAFTARVTDALGNETTVGPIAFTIDTTPPRLTFTSHADGAAVATPNVVVAGGSDDAVTVLVNNAPAAVDLAARTFLTGSLALVEGANTIAATGTDRAGNVGTAQLHLELDTRAPEVGIVTPTADACVDATTLTVSGTVSDPRVASVTVSAGGAPVTATITSGTWTASVLVDEGQQLLTIVAADALGHVTTMTRNVLIDRTAPVIDVRESGAPLTATLFNRFISLLVRATDADPGTIVESKLDGAPYASGTTISAEGAHTLEVTATDCAGHRTVRTFAFTIDRTPPAIRNLIPANESTVGQMPNAISGSTDPDAARIDILGTAIVATPAPDATFVLTAVAFAEGTNRFLLKATDKAGNSAQTDYVVTVKTTAPVVTILENGSRLVSGSLFIRPVTPEIRVNESTATVSATLNGAPFTSGTTITAEGDYRLIATATDSFGHSATAEAIFTIDRTAPVVHITFPASGPVSAEQIEVRGTAGNSVTADVNGIPVTLAADGSFVLPTLFLEFGTTRIVATGRDRAGNVGRDEVEVVRDDIRPGILLTYPPDRALTNRPTTEVLGRVLSPSPDGVVTIGSTAVPIDTLGAFRLSGHALAEGENTITATTKTGNGGTNAATVNVTADFTPPSLTILESEQALEDGARFAERAVLTLQASDNRGSVTTELIVDGTNVLTLPHTVTATGGHSAAATARDQAGNETRVERTFFIGTTGGGSTTCTLNGFDPADNAVVLSPSVTLIGRSGSADGVKVNDVAANVGDGSFRATVELPLEGANAVVLRCTDAAGTPFGDPVTITLNRVTGDPSITITTPEEGFVTADDTLSISGTVGPGVISADINGAPALIAGTDPSTTRPYSVASVRVASGLNVLVAHGRNAAGRVATASRRVFALKNQPAISISSPLTGATTGATKIDLAGTYGNLDPATITVTNVANNATVAPQTVRSSDTSGTFTVIDVPLVAGEQLLRVAGRDQANREATASVTVKLVAGSPSINISAPAAHTYFGPDAGDSFAVSGTFGAAPGSTVEVNGVAATPGEGTFTATAQFSQIGGGATPVVARVTEPGGASAVDTILVTKLAAAPRVIESFPAPNAVEVDAGALLLVLFSAPMDRSTLATGAFRLEDTSGATVSGTLYLDRDVLTFAPATLLARGAHYTLRVTTAAKDVAGTALASEYVAGFTIGTSAPSTPPTLTPVTQAFCGQTVTIAGTAPAGARLRLESGALTLTDTADAQGNFHFEFPISGQSGFAIVRVRVVGSDGSLSPAAELSFRVDCVGPQVLNATYERTGTNRLTIRFSEAIDPATATTGGSGAIFVALNDGRNLGGNATVSGNTVILVPSEDLTAKSFALNVTTAIRDVIGNRLVIPYLQNFTVGGEQPPAGDGSGFISGEIYDATTGRPLAGATINVELPSAAFTTNSDARGRYLVRLPEGAHTIRASLAGYSTVWRQILVPAGAGVVPIDIRQTKRGDTKTSDGTAMSLAHGGETAITRPVVLQIPAGVVAGGQSVSLTAVGAQALTGLLPLGWSPMAAVEVGADTPLTGAQLTFTVPASEVTAASQTLAAVRYDDDRDEWPVIASVVNIASDGKATIPIDAGGAYALVYADKAPGLIAPPLAAAGSPLVGVPAPATPAALLSRAFTLDPPIVLPNGRTVATLQIEGAGSATFPSGTAVQAYIDEELRLADGSRLLDPPFATDLLLYRNLAGNIGISDFHLAPSARAAQVILEIGFDHIRVVPYPGRLDRGTLIGSEGGRIPGDDRIAIDLPAGATPEPLHASATSLTQQDLDAVGAIAGFRIVGGFALSLQRTNESPQDADGDGVPDADPTPVELFKPARATFTLSTPEAALGTQFILAELLDQTPYGKMVRLAAQMMAVDDTTPVARVTTKSIDRSILPLDGVVREGRYLLLAADAPIAFATGLLRLGGVLLPDARVSATPLGVTELTRTTGLYNIPVPSAPAAPFSLTPRHTSTGDGAPYTHATVPAPDAVVKVDLNLLRQPPTLTGVTVFAGNPPAQVPLASGVIAPNVSLTTSVRASFSPNIDPASVSDDSITVLDATTGIAVGGKATAEGTIGVNWSLTPGTRLEPDRRYTVHVSPRIRAANGAELSVAKVFTFVTLKTITNTEVHAERISITIPVDGVSRVTGDPGALPAGWQALVVRRRVDFVTRYQATAAADGSFTFLVGDGGNASDRVTMGDLIDLQAINTAGNLAAIIPLTPFVTEDRRGFVVPAGEAIKVTTPDGVSVDIAAGTFDEPTMVNVNVAPKAAFDDIPSLDHDVNFATSVKLDFEGRAKKPIEVEMAVPAGMDTTNRTFILALKGESIRGPRLMAVDTLRVADGKFTTTLDPAEASRPIGVQSHGGVTTNAVLTGKDLKDYLLRVERSGVYMTLDIRQPVGGGVGWATMNGLQTSHDIFWDTMKSFYASHTYLVERGGRIAIPIITGVPFTVVGVDASTGMQAFTKAYDPIPVGDPGVSNLQPPQNNTGGPYPVFGTPFRVEAVDLNVANVDITSLRNFVVHLANNIVYVEPSDDPLPPETKIELLNVTTGAFTEGTAQQTLVLNGALGHRIVLLIEQREVDPMSPMSIVFNEPIYVEGTEEEPIHEFLKELFTLEKAVLPPDEETEPEFTDVTEMVHFTLDSGGRRVSFKIPSSLQREAIYRLTMKENIADRAGENGAAGLTLGQGAEIENGNASGVGGGNDLHLEFRVRKPGGTIGTFEVQNGTIHDLALNGNLLFIAGGNGGLYAYDVADPASLDGAPTPVATAPSFNVDFWAVATDPHGRIYTTGLGPVAGTLRSYRLEDFVDGGSCCKIYGSSLINWRVGYSSNMGLVSNTMLSDRPESFPRKLQILLQDEEKSYEGLDAFVDDTGATLGTEYPNGMVRLQASFAYVPEHKYLYQRVTVENLTLDMRWSADATPSSAAVINNIIAGPNDRIRVIRNRMTYGVVSHLGYGVGMYDLNAIESNRAPNKPANYQMLAEQVVLTRGKNIPGCFDPPVAPPEPAIQEIWLSSDAAVRPDEEPPASAEEQEDEEEEPPQETHIMVYAPEPYRGMLDLRLKPPQGPNPSTSINNSEECGQRGPFGLVLRGVDPDNDHARVKALKQAYQAASGRLPYPHFLSVSNYRWRLEGRDNKFGVRLSVPNEPVTRDYVLLAAGDLGLMVVEVGGNPMPVHPLAPQEYFPLDPQHLVDIIWIPTGALAVRTIPRTNLAVVVSRYGRVHLVDLSRIDERWKDDGTALEPDALFPTAEKAIAGTPAYPEAVGADDPRIVWTSEPYTALGVLPPVVDPDTGMMYAGHISSKVMKAVAAIDPRIQMKVELGDKGGLSEVGGVVPLGIDPPDDILQRIAELPPCADGTTSRCRENASLGAFRLEVSLPGAIAQSLEASNNELQVAVETERVLGAPAEQTPEGFPRSHLRRFRRDGSAELPERVATNFRLQRLVPDDPELAQALRHQKGFNKFISPWIIAIADPRASAKWVWDDDPTPEDKAKAGCNSCQRPQFLAGQSEAEGVYELWTNGRIIAVRPEIVANGENIFENTPYAYLGAENRLVTRFGTILADTVRPNEVRVAGQNPPVAEGAIQETVYLHSGEVQSNVLDFNAGGRADFDVLFDRTYRSRTLGGTVLGQGWESSNFRRLRALPSGDVELRDSSGETWLFKQSTDGYESPKGFFLELYRSERGWILLDQKWRATAFDDLGRLNYESDEFAEDIAVAAGTNKGNAVRYLYDYTGRLSAVVDPVERASQLTYWKDSEASQPGAYPGLLKEVRDWRGRTTLYEYDALGRLTAVKGVESKGPEGGPPELDLTGDNRPRTEYTYQSVELPNPEGAEPLQDFNDYLEFAGNLETIKEPDQVAAANGVARVTLTYSDLPSERDRLTDQQWGTNETVEFTYTGETSVSSTDAFGQQRSYSLTDIDDYDGRVHVAQGRMLSVPVIDAGDTLPSTADVNLTATSEDLTAEFTYNDEGLHESVEYANGTRVENTWSYTSIPTENRDASKAPGMVLEETKTFGPFLPSPVEMVVKYDKSSDTAKATIISVGRDGDFRDDQSPSRDRDTVAVTEDEEGQTLKSETAYNDYGLPTSIRKKDGDTVKQETTTQYYEPDSTPPLKRSRPSEIFSTGTGIKQKFTYSDLSNGGEKIEITDENRGTKTEVHLDAYGRKTHILVTGADGNTLTDESFGYNASGQLVYHSRQQEGVGKVETRYKYDAMGRQIETSMTGAAVGGSPTTIVEKTEYDYADLKITEFDAATEGGSGPKSVTTIDRLGRPVTIERVGSGGETVKSITGFDRGGSASYESDGVRTAVLTQYDARGRAVGSVSADGLRSETTWGDWDEPLEEITRDSAGTAVSHSKNFFTKFGRLRATTEAVDGLRARSTFRTTADGDTKRGTFIGVVSSVDVEEPFDDLRGHQQIFDASGRLTKEVFGVAENVDGDIVSAFAESEYAYGSGGSVPSKVTSREPLANAESATETTFDGLERPISTKVDGASDASTMTYDEAGNVLVLQAQGMQPSTAAYDSRGFVTESTHPGGGTIQYTYDALGNLRSYNDENDVATNYATDGLGRVTKVDYPDGTSEETVYEDGTGAVKATRDRAGKWMAFAYGTGGRIESIHAGQDTSAPKLIEYDYDAAGRVTAVRNADAGITYEDFDLLGRPSVTRTYRYAVQSGFSAAPAVLDVHTQNHTWSIFDDERESWTMPVAGMSVPADSAESKWLQTIEEDRDAASNIVAQRVLGGSAVVEAEGRAVGKLQFRKRAVGTSMMVTNYGYAGDPNDNLPPGVSLPQSAGTKSLLMRYAASSVGTTAVAGSANGRDAADRVTRTTQVGLDGLISEWMFDTRGRLEQSWLNAETLARPPTVDEHTPTDFRAKRKFGNIFTPPHPAEPKSWTATPNPANQIQQRDFEGQVVDAQVYTFTGGRRTSDSVWTSAFDDQGRLVSIAGTDRKIEYTWDPNDRIVGRTAYRPNLESWVVEDRDDVLHRDGLTPRATFVWDPMEDRLLAIFEEGASITQNASPDGGLLRQYLHGDQGYDDPVRVLARDEDGNVRTYLPIIDEAGAGNLQAVLDAQTGDIVERVLYADAYGDQPRYLQGPVVDKIAFAAKKDDAGQIEKITIEIHLTEELDGATVSGGVQLAAVSADGTIQFLSSVTPELPDNDDFTIRWELDKLDWDALTTSGGTALQIAVRDTLRGTQWGDTRVSSAPEWAKEVYGVRSTSDRPVILEHAFLSLESFFAGIASGATATKSLYGMTDLYLAGSTESATKLFTGFKAAPFVEPATSLVYFRARWYDPATATFLSPDPSGYADSSNLYAAFDSDPVNNSDPTGEIVESVWDAASLGMGIYSISQWDENTSFWDKVLDVAGVGLDAAALALPFVPGGVGAVLKGARGVNAAIDIANATRKAKKILDIAQAVEQAASSVQAGLRVYEAYSKDELSWGNAFDVVQAGMGIRKAAKVAMSKMGAPKMPKADASFDPPCPVNLFAVASCVAPGTPILTADGHAKAIDALRVGDRVAATNVSLEESPTLDDLDWHLVKLEMSNPADPGDVYEIETLRPLAWIVEHEAYSGRTITFETDRSPTDQACVVALERMPNIESGPGRVVLSTFAHRDELVTIHFEGIARSIEASPSHRLFSVDRSEWVPVSDLRAGDRLRTRDGRVAIASIEAREVSRVFDITVESDHSYFIDGADVLSHNNGKKGCGSAKQWMVGPYDELRKLGKGTKFDAHHVGQAAEMKKLLKKAYDRKTAPAILVPKVGHTQIGPRGIVRRKTKAAFKFTAVQELLDRDFAELKRVYPRIPKRALDSLTELNKKMYPKAFKAKK